MIKNLLLIFAFTLTSTQALAKPSKKQIKEALAEIMDDFSERVASTTKFDDSDPAQAAQKHQVFCDLADDHIHHESIAPKIFGYEWSTINKNDFSRNRAFNVITRRVAQDFASQVLKVLSYDLKWRNPSRQRVTSGGKKWLAYKVPARATSDEGTNNINFFVIVTSEEPLTLKIKNLGISMETLMAPYEREATQKIEDGSSAHEIMTLWEEQTKPCD